MAPVIVMSAVVDMNAIGGERVSCCRASSAARSRLCEGRRRQFWIMAGPLLCGASRFAAAFSRKAPISQGSLGSRSGFPAGFLDLPREVRGEPDVVGGAQREEPGLRVLRQIELLHELLQRGLRHALAAGERLELLVRVGDAVAA